MKACRACSQQNPDDAQFCHRCGVEFSEDHESASSDPALDERQLWQTFLGPNKTILFSFGRGWSWEPAANYYLQIFRRYTEQTGPSGFRFALTWHWPAFLFDPFLWFLYRKMYMYALLYAVGPVVSAFLTGDLSVGIVWRIMAGISGNYIYFWHAKDIIEKIKARVGLDPIARLRLLQEEGGAQPYVLWLGAALHFLMFGILIAAFEEGPGESDEELPIPHDPDQKFF